MHLFLYKFGMSNPYIVTYKNLFLLQINSQDDEDDEDND